MLTKKNALFATACLTSLALSCGAVAAQNTIKQFDVDTQGLAEALQELARQGDLQLVFDPALVVGKVSNDVDGRLTSKEAVKQLLKGSGLSFKFNGDTVVVQRAPLEISNQPAKPASVQAQSESIEELLVTGTHIRGGQLTTNQLVVDRAEIERNGYNSVEEIIQALTFSRGTQSSQQRTDVSTLNFNNSLYTGLAGADLRGLGEGTTLIPD